MHGNVNEYACLGLLQGNEETTVTLCHAVAMHRKHIGGALESVEEKVKGQLQPRLECGQNPLLLIPHPYLCALWRWKASRVGGGIG